MASSSDLVHYYARRAPEYEQVYLKPERQDDLHRLKIRLCELMAGHRVLEVACGTGYWTTVIAQTAESIVATDINDSVLRIAAEKPFPPGKVQLLRADAFTLDPIEGDFSAGFAGFWWSHILKAQLAEFLRVFHAKLQPGALVVFVDNCYVKGSSYPITRRDAEGNIYQQRRLADGTVYDVLKNFPEEAEVRRVLAGKARELQYDALTYYWCLSYRCV